MPSLSINRLFFLLLFLCCTSCVDETIQNKQKSTFFNLKDYFAQQVEQLDAVKQVKKSVSINGVVEELIQDSINFSEELAVFVASDINRIAWQDKYRIDSVHSSSQQLQSVTYTALDNKLKTQFINIQYKNNRVEKITIKNNRSSMVSDSSQELEYIPSAGYTIISNQNTSLSEDRFLKVTVEFINK